MKLRNKKTGEVIDLDIANIKAQYGGISVIPEPVKLGGNEYVYYSLEGLVHEWEDYKPTEPLIKDDKIRKAVRAWAEACGADDADIVRHYGAERWIGLRYENPNTGWVSKFEIDGFGSCNQLGNEKVYTITELCGEEEE